MNFQQIATMVLPFILMFGVFYFLLILPEKKTQDRTKIEFSKQGISSKID